MTELFPRRLGRRPVRIVLGLIFGLAAGAECRAQPADALFGQRLAQRYCSSCHAIGVGRSPNPDAPPFPSLYKRYRNGGLDALLREGMLAPVDPPEEGGVPLHPRMPQAVLGDDEIDALKAYLHSLEPVDSDPHAAASRP